MDTIGKTTTDLIHQHTVLIRLLNQIDYHEKQKAISLETLNNLPKELHKTCRNYQTKIEKSNDIISKLKFSYQGLSKN